MALPMAAEPRKAAEVPHRTTSDGSSLSTQSPPASEETSSSVDCPASQTAGRTATSVVPEAVKEADTAEDAVTKKMSFGSLWSDGAKRRFSSDERWTRAAKYGAMGVGAVFGWATRFLLKQIFTVQLGVTGSDNGGAIHGDVLANMFGAFIAGLLAALKMQLEPWHPSIFWGLSLGYCGSCTTFSSWMVEAGLQLSLATSAGNVGRSLIAKQICQSGLLIAFGLMGVVQSFALGKRAGIYLEPHIEQRCHSSDSAAAVMPSPLHMRLKSVLYWSVLLVMWCLMGGIFLRLALSASEDVSSTAMEKMGLDLLAGMCLAPFGAWCRFWLAQYNKHKAFVCFPAFTYAANMFAMGISMACWVLASLGEPDEDKHHLLRSHTWTVAVAGGFCGCLSTASTFASELHALAGKRFQLAFRYGGVSIVSAQVLVLLVTFVYAQLL